jgi:transposase
MLSFTGSLRVFVALEPCDMRKGFEATVLKVETK